MHLILRACVIELSLPIGLIHRLFTYGSKDPYNRVLGPKYYNGNGIWALKTQLFGSLDP